MTTENLELFKLTEAFVSVNVSFEDSKKEKIRVTISFNEEGERLFAIANGHTGKVRDLISEINNGSWAANVDFAILLQRLERAMSLLNEVLLSYGDFSTLRIM